MARRVPDPTPSPKKLPKPAARNRRLPPDPTKLPKSNGRRPSSPVTAQRNNGTKPPPPPRRSGTTFWDWLAGKGK